MCPVPIYCAAVVFLFLRYFIENDSLKFGFHCDFGDKSDSLSIKQHVCMFPSSSLLASVSAKPRFGGRTLYFVFFTNAICRFCSVVVAEFSVPYSRYKPFMLPNVGVKLAAPSVAGTANAEQGPEPCCSSGEGVGGVAAVPYSAPLVLSATPPRSTGHVRSPRTPQRFNALGARLTGAGGGGSAGPVTHRASFKPPLGLRRSGKIERGEKRQRASRNANAFHEYIQTASERGKVGQRLR